jgi:hypothetical protein
MIAEGGDSRLPTSSLVMLARGRAEHGYEAWALRLIGETVSHHARPDAATAATHYAAAMALASELEMRPLVATAPRRRQTLPADG